MKIRVQPVQIATDSDDRESLLVFSDESLVAVLVRLSSLHGREAGRLFLEVGFGPLDSCVPLSFANLNEAEAWIRRSLR